MNSEYVIIFLLCSIVATSIIQRTLINQLLRKLLALKNSNNYTEYLELLKSSYARIMLPKFNIDLLELSLYIDTLNNEDVYNFIQNVNTKKYKERDLVVLYSRIIGYAAITKDFKLYSFYKDALETVCKGKSRFSSILNDLEVLQLKIER